LARFNFFAVLSKKLVLADKAEQFARYLQLVRDEVPPVQEVYEDDRLLVLPCPNRSGSE
jgi:hypothetical protein